MDRIKGYVSSLLFLVGEFFLRKKTNLILKSLFDLISLSFNGWNNNFGLISNMEVSGRII